MCTSNINLEILKKKNAVTKKVKCLKKVRIKLYTASVQDLEKYNSLQKVKSNV